MPAKYRKDLPQLGEDLFLTDGGLETTLVFHEGRELPEFAAFPLLDEPADVMWLRGYFRRYMAIAAEAGAGYLAEAATWRANPKWAAKLGYDRDDRVRINQDAVNMLLALRPEFENTTGQPFVVSGAIGPRDDGYHPDVFMTGDEAAEYHAEQVEAFAASSADLVTSFTITHTGEAIGIVRAALAAGIPAAIGFTLDTDGRLPSGQALGEAITEVDEATGAGPAYYMVNCAHPSHFEDVIRAAAGEGESWLARLRALRANASRRSHAELDEAEDLDAGDPEELGADYARLREAHPGLTILGGCCGTDEHHVAAISHAVTGNGWADGEGDGEGDGEA